MKLKYLAHAAFLLTANNGTRILTDPYKSGQTSGALNYLPITDNADIITISHSHYDHSFISQDHQKAILLSTPKTLELNAIEVSGLQVFHDSKKGKERGSNIIFTIKIDGIIICHLGDLGHDLTETELENIHNVDVLLIPVGEIFTISTDIATSLMLRINPKICIPMHYKTEAIPFNLSPITKFLTDKDKVKIVTASEIILDKQNLPTTTEIWALSPSQLKSTA
jgi:L-ascorbate metabolism protein UlaG (beta-lactamase superfamily)